MKTWINVFVALSLLLSSGGYHQPAFAYVPGSGQSSTGQETTPTTNPEVTPTPTSTATLDYGAYPAPATPTPEPTEPPVLPTISATPTPQPTVSPTSEPTPIPTDEVPAQKEPLLWTTEVNCGAQGQNARLTWQMSSAAADMLTQRDNFRLSIPRGLTPFVPTDGTYNAELGILSMPASPKGEMAFTMSNDMVEMAALTAEWLTGDQVALSVQLEITPGGYGEVNAEGGRVVSKAYGVEVEVPEQVFNTQTAICIGQVSEIELPTVLSGKPFQINAYGTETGEEITSFDKQVEIRVSYDPKIFGDSESKLMLFYFNQEYQDWVGLNSYVEPETNTLVGYTAHFTPFDYKAESWESARLPTVDSFAVAQFTGAAMYSFPLQVPAGPGGWQPSLELRYNSQTVDSANSLTQSSWVGIGWSLDTGYIQRNMGDMPNYYGDYVGGAINNDSDTGHDLDDTFSLVLNGQSWRLLRLPDQDQDTETIDYRTEDESFMRIRRFRSQGTRDEGNKTYPIDNSYWVVWDKTGNTYTFDGTGHYPIGCHVPYLLTWKWSLTKATNSFQKTIEYKYNSETVHRVASIYGPESECDAPLTDMAVYPDTITYPNSNYRILFSREEREDYKAAWLTGPDSLYQRVFFERSLLDWIRIEHKNSNNEWELVRKYDLIYEKGAIFPNIIWQTAIATSTTPALVEIIESGTNETLHLPTTTFTYDDKMHLTKGENGYGGVVEFEYENSGAPWYELETTQLPVVSQTMHNHPHSDTYRVIGTIGYPVIDPGQTYKLNFTVWPNISCDFYVGDATHKIPVTILSQTNYADRREYTGFVTLPPESKNQSSVYCMTNGANYSTRVVAYSLVTRYRVTGKSVTDEATHTTTTVSYTYTGAATNNLALFTPGDNPMSQERTEFRGHSSVSEELSNHLVTTSWFLQKDDYIGNSQASVVSYRDEYDDFDSMDTNLWSFTHPGTRQTIDKQEGEPVLKMTNDTATWDTQIISPTNRIEDGTSAMVSFKITGENTQALLALQRGTPGNADYRRWAVQIYKDPTSNQAMLRTMYRVGWVQDWQYNTLLPTDIFKTDTWYVVMLTPGSEQFGMRVWERDDPSTYVEYFYPMTPGVEWYFRAELFSGTIYLDDYREGQVYAFSHSLYGLGDDEYTSPEIVAPRNWDEVLYTDFGISWIVPTSTVSYSLAKNGLFTGSRQESLYDPENQGDNQFGNLTHSTQYYWNGSIFQAVRGSLTTYYPATTTNGYLVGLPAATDRFNCSGTSCNFNDATKIIASIRLIYDNNSQYDQPPTIGIVKKHRSLLTLNEQDPSDRTYSDQLFAYDSWGNLTATTVYTNPGTETTFASTGAQESATAFDTTDHTYPISATNARGHTSYLDYDHRLGVPTREVSSNGAVTTATYDTFGRITSIVRPGDDSTNPTLQFSYNIDSGNYLFWTEARQGISDSNYSKVRKYYNGLGQLLQTQTDADVSGTPKTVVEDVYYDEMGRAYKQAMPYSVNLTNGVFITPSPNPDNVTLTTYDEIGRVHEVRSPDGTTQTSNYTIQTEGAIPYNVVISTNGRGNTTVSWSDTLGRTYKVVPPTGPGVTYTYDAADHLVQAQYGLYTTTLTYDIAGRKLSLDDPDMGYWVYQYDALGNLTQQTDARGCVTGLEYDELNRLLEKNYSNASGGACGTIAANTSPVSYTYDDGTNGLGRRTGMEDDSGSTIWQYDLRGRLVGETVEITGVGTYTTGWNYNSADLLAGMTYPNGEIVSTSYNAQGLVTAVDSESWVCYASQAKYDEAGRLLEWTLGNGVKTTNTYNAWNTQGGRLQSTSSITNQTPAATRQHLAYSYDANGNLTTIQDTVASETLNYTYDVLDRLTGVSGAYSQSYGYNAATGNLASKAGQTLAYADTDHPHAATGMGSNTYTYDANGNMVTRSISTGTYTLSYNAEGQLVGLSGGGVSAAYTYNGDGERVKVEITSGGETKITAYVGDYFEVSVGESVQMPTPIQPNCSTSYCVFLPQVISSSLSIPAGHAWTSYYNINGQRAALRVQSNQEGVGDGIYYLLTDHLGSTAITLDAGANQVAELRYSAWGETRYTSGTTPTERRYTGQLQAEAGLYFYNARFYDSDLGRFISADTIVPQPGNPQNWDRYAYVRNSPINYTDPSGHISEEESEEANEIINQLLAYKVKVKVDWGERKFFAIYWDTGKWTLEMLQNLIGGVQQLANAMGGIGQFNTNLNGVTVVLRSMEKGGLSKAHKVILNSSGFSIWTVIHELAHSWDAVNGNNFSRTLEKETGGETKWFKASNCTSDTAPGCNHVGYYYGGTPPKGSDYSFDRKEDFAESVATYVLGVDLIFITENFSEIKEFQYTDFTNTPRWNYIDSLMTK